MTPSENREVADQEQDGQGQLQEGLPHSELDQARAADQAAHVPPSKPKSWAGRAILGLQKLVDKVLAGRIVQLQGQVIDQDREQSELAHDVGELTIQLIQMNRMLQSIDQRLSRLEATNKPPDRE